MLQLRPKALQAFIEVTSGPFPDLEKGTESPQSGPVRWGPQLVWARPWRGGRYPDRRQGAEADQCEAEAVLASGAAAAAPTNLQSCFY